MTMRAIREVGMAILGAALALGMLSCAGPVDVKTLTPKPPTIMVAKKLEVPLYIVLDPAREARIRCASHREAAEHAVVRDARSHACDE